MATTEAEVSAAAVQQLFLQAMLSRRTASGALAKLLWQKSAAAVRGARLLLPSPPACMR
jgi:hypothetical protein